MDTKPIRPKRPSTVDCDQLEIPSEADEARADAWIARNREQINRDIAEARKSLAEGKGKTYRSSEEFVADFMGRARKRLARRRRSKA
jgi:hypothetical protein